MTGGQGCTGVNDMTKIEGEHWKQLEEAMKEITSGMAHITGKCLIDLRTAIHSLDVPHEIPTTVTKKKVKRDTTRLKR